MSTVHLGNASVQADTAASALAKGRLAPLIKGLALLLFGLTLYLGWLYFQSGASKYLGFMQLVLAGGMSLQNWCNARLSRPLKWLTGFAVILLLASAGLNLFLAYRA